MVMDKVIVERLTVCVEKAREMWKAKYYQPSEITVGDLALALYKEGYRGKKLDLIADIEVLRDKKYGYIRAGNPSFMGLFGRDSLITSWQLLDFDPLIAKNTLINLANKQGTTYDENTGEEPGKILHEYYPEDSTDVGWFRQYKKDIDWLNIEVPVYFSVDSTPLFLILSEFYHQKTDDLKLYEQLRAAKVGAVKWILTNTAKGKVFLGYEANETGLKNQSWKDSEEYHIKEPVMPVEVQGYVYAALNSMQYKKESDILKEKFLEQFWMEEKNYFAFALDGDHKQVTDITSNPGHLLFTGILDGETSKIKAINDTLFSEKLWTPYGIRTLATDSKLFESFSYHSGCVWPHDNWIIAQGLKNCGYMVGYQKIVDALNRAYDTLGYIPEYYGVIKDKIIALPACYPQAWSSGALLNFTLETKNGIQC